MMHGLRTLLFLLSPFAVSGSLRAPQHFFSNSFESSDTGFRIPTAHESVVQARRILTLSSIATLSTVFPSQHHSSSSDDFSTLENRPAAVAGSAIGLMDYYADCQPTTGNPTFFAVGIATSFKYAAGVSNVSLSLRWQPPPHHRPSRDPYKFAPANLPRFSLLGYLEDISAQTVKDEGIAECFTRHHPDAKLWLPGNDIHESHWVRLVVEYVYWFGGFGDRAYIGWIPVEEWRNVTAKEIDHIRLPGEEKPRRGSRWWPDIA